MTPAPHALWASLRKDSVKPFHAPTRVQGAAVELPLPHAPLCRPPQVTASQNLQRGPQNLHAP